MAIYVQHLALTAWRKKSAVLIAFGLLSLIVFGLQFTKSGVDKIKPQHQEDDSPQAVADAFIQNSNNNIKFVEETMRKPEDDYQNTQNVNSRPRSHRILENEQQLGVPYVNFNGMHPYVPKERLVHLDLKGAPPVVGFYYKFFPLVRKMGATGILIEYEDMFPYTGILNEIKAKNAYTAAQITEILKLAQTNHLTVIPLIQTFGHMEFALKHQKWDKLREVLGSPQALCPSRNNSLDFVREMVKQVLELHPDIKYLHVGCDEVFQMGECEICRLEPHETLFLKHIQNVARIVKETRPGLGVIIWDDMLRHISQQNMRDYKLGDLVEPMVWVYAEDIYRFVQPPVWDKYASVFQTAWAASAFKGAFGETLAVPDSRRHLENNLRWLDVMSQQSKDFKGGFKGLVLTGWQRYDHFAVLCELLPAGIPSLALSLIATSHGYFNSSLKHEFLSALTCPESGRNDPFINLDSDPFLWDKIGRCMFPGRHFFMLTYKLHSKETEVEEYLKSVKVLKGWMTDYNVRRNYSLPLRVDELMADWPRIYNGVTSLIESSVDGMIGIFDNFTVSEWIEQKIYPYVIQLEQIQNQSIALRSVNHWPSRPLAPLRDLQRLGVPIPPQN